MYDELKDKTVEQRMEQYSLNGDRADVIVPAAEIFLRIASVTGDRPIIVPTIGIIDGIVHSLYVRHLEQEAPGLVTRGGRNGRAGFRLHVCVADGVSAERSAFGAFPCAVAGNRLPG